MAENSSEFETVSQAGTASATESGIYCTRCGYHNPPGRGACVMCLNLLLDRSAGANCPACGARNPSGSRFCSHCGSLIDTTAVAVFSRPDLAAKVLDAVGDVGLAAGVGEEAYGDEDAYVGEAVDHYDEEPGVFEELEEYAEPMAVEGAKPDAVEVPDESVPGPILEAPEPVDEIAPDEDFFASAPAVVDTSEDDFAPPPPPGVVEAEGDEFAPPPAPGLIEEEDEFAPPPPPGVVAEEEEFAPPPPPGVVFEEDEFAPPPPPPFDEISDELPPPPPPPPPGMDDELPPLESPAAAEEADFGGWELESEEGEEEDDQSSS